MPDKIWSFGRQTEVDYVNSRIKKPEDRQLCYDVIDAVLEIRQTDIVSLKHVEAFSCALQHPNESVFAKGGKRLVECSHFSILAADTLRRLALDPKWRTRFNVMCCLDERPPEPLAIELLEIGLKDRSAKVARHAAFACDNVRYPSALALLENRLSVEERPDVLEAINWTIGLMRTEPVINGKQEERHYDGAVFVRNVLRDK